MSVDAEQIHDALPRILAYWRGWLRRIPDERPRAGERGTREQSLVAAVVEAAFARPHDPCALQDLERAACDYGATPRRQRLDPQEVSEELGLLRIAIWRCVRETHVEPDERLGAIGCLDNAISTAVQFTLRGAYSLAPEYGHRRQPDRESPAE